MSHTTKSQFHHMKSSSIQIVPASKPEYHSLASYLITPPKSNITSPRSFLGSAGSISNNQSRRRLVMSPDPQTMLRQIDSSSNPMELYHILTNSLSSSGLSATNIMKHMRRKYGDVTGNIDVE